jgi:3'-phosphoadenosine 5'-phosphosulfate sulfotransferase (PAPS reductase)/FAD synthetase
MQLGPISNFHQWKQDIQNEIGNRKVVCSISGGKDSTCMALLLKEAELDYESIFMDTGWEHEATLEYIEKYLTKYVGPIVHLGNPKGGMRDLIVDKGQFPRKTARWCTGELKLTPAKKYLKSLPYEPVNAVGIRAEESASRSKYPEWEYSSEFKCDVWRPILNWTEDDVIFMLQRHGIRPNPLYLLGSKRVGCWPCVFSSKKSLRVLAKESPDRVREIRQLESYLNEEKEELTHTWFRIGSRPAPIDEVIHWAHHSCTGRELFASTDRDQGCMRWGMCEFEHPVDQQHKINHSSPD